MKTFEEGKESEKVKRSTSVFYKNKLYKNNLMKTKYFVEKKKKVKKVKRRQS